MQPFKPQFEGIISPDPHIAHEESDISVNGIFVFLALLAASVAFIFVFCYGMRIALNRFVEATNPTPNIWMQREQQQMSAERERDLHAAPGKPVATEEMITQREMEQLAIRFPEPRVQTDDDIVALQRLHGQENAMLNQYRWVNKAAGKVSVPINQAMAMIAQRGLPTTQNEAGAELHAVPAATTSGTVQSSPEIHETEPSPPAAIVQ